MNLRRHGRIRYVESEPATETPARVFLLIHGLGGSIEQWSLAFDQLSKTEHVIAVDVPGFGGSKNDLGKRFTIDSAAEQIAEFIEQRDLTNCIVVSHSIACVVAGKVVALSPIRCRRLILVSGALIRASEIAQRPIRTIGHPRIGTFVLSIFIIGSISMNERILHALATSPLLRRTILWPVVARPEQIRPSDILKTLPNTGSRAALEILATASNIDFRKILSEIPMPVDLIYGDRDRLISDEDIDELRKLVDLERVEILKDCGHWPWIEDVGGLVSALLITE